MNVWRWEAETCSNFPCCVSLAKSGNEVAAGSCFSEPPALLPDPDAPRRGQSESWVQSQSLHPSPGTGCCMPSCRGPIPCHPAVQCCPGSHCQQSVVPGAQQAVVATMWVLAAWDPWLRTSSGLELCPAPDLATQNHPQPAAATVGAAVYQKSVTSLVLFNAAQVLLMVL